jgi:hydroxymethylglutaryl-CoA lyase
VLPARVKIVEVGPRDGLQNEKANVPTEIKMEWINRLSLSGLSAIEAGSFVSQIKIPALSDSERVFAGIKRQPGVNYSALVPNLKGFLQAELAHVNSIAVFTAASELFNQKNIHCSIDESLERADLVLKQAKEKNIPVRGYISCVLGCPYEGAVSMTRVLDLTVTLFQMGCYEVSLGDTIGVGTAKQVGELLERVGKRIDLNTVAVHFHDTYGQALTNVYRALQLGVSIVDSSTGGLGGCPYAPGASGNLATEDLLYLLNGLEIETGVSLKAILKAAGFINQALSRNPCSKVAMAYAQDMQPHV